MTAKAIQCGVRLDSWHAERLDRIARSASLTRTATAALLLELAIQLAIDEQPPPKGAAFIAAIRSRWP